MASIDKRVVEMKFDNGAFERGVATTLSTLDNLKSKLNFGGAAKGLEGLGAAAGRFDISGIAGGVDSLTAKFGALQVAGVTALATITNQAVNAGLNIAKSLTIGPIGQGFDDYNAKLTSVKTIMNSTGKDIQTVNSYFTQLDDYADKTVYRLSDMTSAFAKFTNAGISLEDAVPAIKGIGNLTALAGQGADAAQIAYYNLSQSLAGGFLSRIDFKSLELANIATKGFKTELINAALAAGTLKKGAKGVYSIPGSKKAFTEQSLFTEGLQEQFIKADTLTKVLNKYGNEQTALGKKALSAAQDVKSLPMMMETLRASVGTQFTTTFELLLGNVEESTVLFTGLTNTISKFVTNSGKYRNAMLFNFKALGGREAGIDAIKNSFKALTAILGPIGKAFREVFPRTKGKELFDLVVKIREFTKGLIIGKENAENIGRTFKGIFSIFKIFTTIIGQTTKGLFSIFGILGTGAGGGISSLLELTAVAGDFITGIQEWLSETGAIKAFFAVLLSPLKLIKPGVEILAKLANAFADLLTGDVSAFKDGLAGVGDSFKELFGSVLGRYRDFTGTLSDGLAKIEAFFTNMANRAKSSGNALVSGLASAVARVSGIFSEFFGNANASFSTLIASITGATTEGQSFLSGFGSGVFGFIIGAITNIRTALQDLKDSMDFDPVLAGFSSTFDGVSTAANGSASALTAVGSSISAFFIGIGQGLASLGEGLEPIVTAIRNFFSTLIEKITGGIKGTDGEDAIAVFNTGVLVTLILVVRKFLNSFGGTVRELNTLFSSAAGTFDQLSDSLKTMQQGVRADILLKIAISVGILAAALFVLSKIEPDRLKSSLIALGVVMALLAATLIIITKHGLDASSLKIAAAGIALAGLAAAILVLALAVKVLGSMDPKELAQGLGAVAALLAGLTLFTKFAALDKGGVKAGAGLMLMAVAINILSIAVRTLGSMKPKDLIQGAGAIAFLLGALVLATKGMEETLKGSAAFLIMASALAILIPSLIALSLVPADLLGKALTVVAISLLLLVGAANAMTKALPGAAAIIAMAGAIAVLTTPLLALSLVPGDKLAKALVAVAVALAILVVAANAMTTALPGAAALIVVAAAIGLLVPALVVLSAIPFKKLLGGIAGLALVLAVLIAGVYALAPVIGIMILATKSIALLGGAVLLAGLGFLAFSVALASLAVTGAAGFAVIVAGIVSFLAILPLIGRQVGYAFTTFIAVVAAAAPKLISAFKDIVIAWLRSLQETVPEAIITMGIILKALLDEIVLRVPQIYAAGLDLILGFLRALRDRIVDITNVVIDIVALFLQTLKSRLPNIIQAGIDLLIAFLDGIAEGIRDNDDKMRSAGLNIGKAIVEGLVEGVSNGKDAVIQAAKDLADKLPSWVKKILQIESPSKVFAEIGKFTAQGLALGLDNNAGVVKSSSENIGDVAMNSLKSSLADLSSLTAENMDMSPTIRPVFDLSGVKKDSAFIEDMLAVKPLAVNATVSKVQDVAAGYNTGQNLKLANSQQMQRDIKALVASVSAKSTADAETAGPRPVVFNIDTIQDGDSLMRRARASNRMLSLAEGGDSTQMELIP